MVLPIQIFSQTLRCHYPSFNLPDYLDGEISLTEVTDVEYKTQTSVAAGFYLYYYLKLINDVESPVSRVDFAFTFLSNREGVERLIHFKTIEECLTYFSFRQDLLHMFLEYVDYELTDTQLPDFLHTITEIFNAQFL